MRNGRGLWSKRWSVLQEDRLHLFKRPDEVVPVLTIPLKQCEVRRANKKTKKFTFEVNVPSSSEDYCFAADDEKKLLSWMRMLRVIADEEEEEKRFALECKFLLLNSQLYAGSSNMIVKKKILAAQEFSCGVICLVGFLINDIWDLRLFCFYAFCEV